MKKLNPPILPDLVLALIGSSAAADQRTAIALVLPAAGWYSVGNKIFLARTASATPHAA